MMLSVSAAGLLGLAWLATLATAPPAGPVLDEELFLHGLEDTPDILKEFQDMISAQSHGKSHITPSSPTNILPSLAPSHHDLIQQIHYPIPHPGVHEYRLAPLAEAIDHQHQLAPFPESVHYEHQLAPLPEAIAHEHHFASLPDSYDLEPFLMPQASPYEEIRPQTSPQHVTEQLETSLQHGRGLLVNGGYHNPADIATPSPQILQLSQEAVHDLINVLSQKFTQPSSLQQPQLQTARGVIGSWNNGIRNHNQELPSQAPQATSQLQKTAQLPISEEENGSQLVPKAPTEVSSSSTINPAGEKGEHSARKDTVRLPNVDLAGPGIVFPSKYEYEPEHWIDEIVDGWRRSMFRGSRVPLVPKYKIPASVIDNLDREMAFRWNPVQSVWQVNHPRRTFYITKHGHVKFGPGLDNLNGIMVWSMDPTGKVMKFHGMYPASTGIWARWAKIEPTPIHYRSNIDGSFRLATKDDPDYITKAERDAAKRRGYRETFLGQDRLKSLESFLRKFAEKRMREEED